MWCFVRVLGAIGIEVFGGFDGDIAEFEEPGANFEPGARGGVHEGKVEEEGQNESEFEGHECADGVIDFTADAEREEDGDEDDAAEDFEEVAINLGIGYGAADECTEWDGGIGSEVGENGSEVEDEVDGDPEEWVRGDAKLAGEDGFAAIKCVPTDFHIVNNLKHNAECGEPKEGAAVACSDGRASEPFSAADSGTGHNESGAEHEKEFVPCEDWRFGEIGDGPWRHVRVAGLLCEDEFAFVIELRAGGDGSGT